MIIKYNHAEFCLFPYVIRLDGPVSVASSLKVGYLFETAFHKCPKEVDQLLDHDYESEHEKDIVAEEFDRSAELWTNREVVLAARVLSAKNPKKHGLKFASDNQMRRVYDIIFEVFRCKTNHVKNYSYSVSVCSRVAEGG